jgi:hypothetical protein
MRDTLYHHFNQASVLEAINQMPGAITWLNLDHSIFAANHIGLAISGFLKQHKAEGNSYIDMPCPVSECYQEFIAQDERAKQSTTPAEFLGLYCFTIMTIGK